MFTQKQIYQKQSFNQSNQRCNQSVLLLIKQFLLFIFENASNLRNQTCQANEKFDKRNKKSFKRKTYVLNEFDKKNEQKLIEKFFFVDFDNKKQQTYYFENLDYYDSNYSNQNNDSNNFVNNYFTLSIFMKY